MGECFITRRGGKEFHLPTLVQNGTSGFDCASLGEGFFLISASATASNDYLALQDTSHRVRMYSDGGPPYAASLFRSCAVVQIVKVGDSYDIYVYFDNGLSSEKLLTGITTSITLYNYPTSRIYKLD